LTLFNLIKNILNIQDDSFLKMHID